MAYEQEVMITHKDLRTTSNNKLDPTIVSGKRVAIIIIGDLQDTIIVNTPNQT